VEIRATDGVDVAYLFQLLLTAGGLTDEMVNLLCWHLGEGYVLRVCPRAAHRPQCYYAEGAEAVLYSPGALDMGGLLAIAREEDFLRLTAEMLDGIFSEVCPSVEWMEELIAKIRPTHGN
jgi:hypothetical protein